MKNLNYSANKDNHKIGRNDPCFCGSGKKYKKCCLAANVNEESQDDDAQTQQGLLQSLMNRVKDHHKDKDCTIGTSEEMGLTNMSDIIVEFAEDLLDMAENHTAQKNVLTFVIVAWNIAILMEAGEESALDHLNEFYHMAGIKKNSEEGEALTLFVLMLVARKHVEYGHIHRFIEDFEVTKMKNGDFHLNIASIVVPPAAISQKSFASKILGQKKKSKLLREPKS